MNNKRFITPFLIPLSALIAGILWQHYYPYNTTNLVVTFLGLIFFFYIAQKKHHPLIFILTCFFFGGSFLLYAQQKKQAMLTQELYHEPFDAYGVVVDQEIKEEGSHQFILKIAVYKTQKKNWQKAKPHTFNLSYYCKYRPKIHVGDTVKLYHIQIKPNKKETILTNAPTFDQYLTKEGLAGIIFCIKPDADLIARPSLSLTRYLVQKRNAIYNQFRRKFSRKTFKLFSSLFLGAKSFKAIDPTKEAFVAWGLAHYLARSGLHIVLLIFTWTFFLNFIPMPFWQKRLLLLLLTVFYSALSWSGISFIRSLSTLTLYEIGRIWKQQLNFLHFLTIVCLIILLTNPIQLFFLDFQLSFALTFALSLAPTILKIKTFQTDKKNS